MCLAALLPLVISQALKARVRSYPKEPDIVERDPAYGEERNVWSCLEAMKTMPDER